jgi:hypothetical protein
VIEAEELAEKTGYSRPHTVHCMPGDNVVVSMLGAGCLAGPVTFAHIGGLPIEETLGSLGPVVLLAAGAASARLSARVRHLGARQRRRAADRRGPCPVKGADDDAAR